MMVRRGMAVVPEGLVAPVAQETLVFLGPAVQDLGQTGCRDRVPAPEVLRRRAVAWDRSSPRSDRVTKNGRSLSQNYGK